MSEEKKFILERIESVKESIYFFSNAMKPEREKWVVNELLDYIGVERTKDKIISSDDEPVDVKFKDGRFQIKEILDQERKRTAEYKESLQTAGKAQKVEDLFEQYSPRDIKFKDVLVVVFDQVKNWTKKYPPEVVRPLTCCFI